MWNVQVFLSQSVFQVLQISLYAFYANSITSSQQWEEEENECVLLLSTVFVVRHPSLFNHRLLFLRQETSIWLCELLFFSWTRSYCACFASLSLLFHFITHQNCVFLNISIQRVYRCSFLPIHSPNLHTLLRIRHWGGLSACEWETIQRVSVPIEHQ